MRLIITLEASKDFAYDKKYYSKLQGFFYGLLRGTKFSSIHDNGSIKQFSYSNIFPSKDSKIKDKRTLIFATPNNELINAVYEKVGILKQTGQAANIGEMGFIIKDVKEIKSRIG